MYTKRGNKFKAKKTTVDGIKFDSKREAARYAELKLLANAGKITDLQVHPRYELKNAHTEIRYPNGRQAVYTADFSYCDGDKVVIEDVKGQMTQAAKFRIAVFESLYKLQVDIIK